MISFAITSASDYSRHVLCDVRNPEKTGHGSLSGHPGRGELEIVRGPRRSVVCCALATSPLRLLLPANHGQAAWIYTATYGGGLVDGDSMSLGVTVGPGASAFLSTQAS